MKKILLTICLFLTLTTTCNAAEEEWWSTKHTVMESMFVAAHVADWGTTQDIKNHPNMYETNVILGKHPSTGQVNSYMLSALIIHPVVSYLLPPKWREVWQVSTFSISMACVLNNYSLGLKMAF